MIKKYIHDNCWLANPHLFDLQLNVVKKKKQWVLQGIYLEITKYKKVLLVLLQENWIYSADSFSPTEYSDCFPTLRELDEGSSANYLPLPLLTSPQEDFEQLNPMKYI